MQTELPLEVGRRTDYTFKHNAYFGRHGWLRLTPAHSVKLIAELVKKDCRSGAMILDPFSGTATTGVVAAEMGLSAILFDINPFLTWFGNAKCHRFDANRLQVLSKRVRALLESVGNARGNWLPPIHNIERWWRAETLENLAKLRQAIAETFGEPGENHYHSLVWIAFSRLAIETSSAAFDHVSMSFKEHSVQYEPSQIKLLFEGAFNHLVATAKTQWTGNAKVRLGDSRDLSRLCDEKFDVVITSPPYPNRISYVRELRPYMYWLKFLQNSVEASALDWQAIGGTWGTATSNLKNWQPSRDALPDRLYEVCEKVKTSDDKHAELMSKYVHKYFEDMMRHLGNLKPLLKPNARLNYIVGNSSFYGHFVPTERILADMFAQLGYKKIEIATIRRRNTKRGLLEFNVSARFED